MRDEVIKEIVSGLSLPPAIAQKLLNKYLETLPKDVERLNESIVQKDFTAAAKMAHSIRGASGNLRITRIFQIASELEPILLNTAQEGAKEEIMEKVNAMLVELDELVKKLV